MAVIKPNIVTIFLKPKNRSRLTRITRNLLRIKAFSSFGLINSR